MRLATDYDQWYDGIFSGQGPVFSRMAFTKGGLPKRAQFDLFNKMQLATPPHGLVSELAERIRIPILGENAPGEWAEDLKCLVYLDECAHRGEGKTVLSLADACCQYPGHFASLFVPIPGGPVAFRMVRFGRLAFWLRQEGQPGNWQSNFLDQETVLRKWTPNSNNPIPRVLWAIDFLPTPFGLLAVDFNTAPQLVTLGEEKSLAEDEIRAELAFAGQNYPDHLNQF